ncbi:hypothetical protein LZP73_15865 [Shewanella sp. AS16]|uniref:RHS repeat-associated core domain-containing protein n=1 Tax=Shewanella sp. AS16 TaxID=2907625 RepID=UPI001F25A09F|nr:RHS repeat-associated core domain-containing protein [Shewanella sp. AS16]MCE9687665.1 hypothetical protein [Shewanella sp. AS16]
MFRFFAPFAIFFSLWALSAPSYAIDSGGIEKHYLGAGKFSLSIYNPYIASLSVQGCAYPDQLSSKSMTEVTGVAEATAEPSYVIDCGTTTKWFRSKVISGISPLPGEQIAASTNTVEQGILPIGDYSYRYQKCTASGYCDKYSEPLSVKIQSPSAPAQLNIQTPSFSSIELSWELPQWLSLNNQDSIVEQSYNGATWTKIYSGNHTSLTVPTGVGEYQYRVKTCSFGACSTFLTSDKIARSGGTIEKLDYQVYQDASGNIYLVRPPQFIPIAGEIFIPIFIADKGNVIIVVKNGTIWSISEISYDQFLTRNASRLSRAAVRYQNIFGSDAEDIVISLDGNFKNSFVLNDISATTHDVREQDVSLAPWLQKVVGFVVEDAGGSDIAPTENVDLAAAALKGAAGVSGGQASYQIPIDLPPGRNGVQPTVSLSYNSQNGNGIVGVGWALNAGSAISRCAATYAQDGFTRAVTFDAASDRLCLDGQRLMAVSGTYGASGTVYRTEMDSFVKVVQSGGINSATASFTVYKPDGNSATYGTESNSRFAPSGLTTVLSWKVAQESFSNGANTIDYEYDDSIAGEHLLSRIYYTGTATNAGDRRVEFGYLARPDARQNYTLGGKLLTSRRLDSITTFVGSTRSVSLYKLVYQPSKASKRSLLKSVQECGFNQNVEQCSPATEFEWQNTQHFAAPEPLKFGGQEIYADVRNIERILPYGDVDGDGSVDFPGYMVDAEQNITGTNSLSLNNTCRYIVETFRYDCFQTDFDMDGKIDPFRFQNGYVEIQYSTKGAVYTRTAVPFVPGTSRSHPGDQMTTIQDIDGDGWPDMVINRYNAGHAQLEVYLHSQNINTPYRNAEVIYNFANRKIGDTQTPTEYAEFANDFDGNGLADLLIISKDGNIRSRLPMGQPRLIKLNKSTPGQLNFYDNDAPKSQLLNSDGLFSFFSYFMDINGDGLTDVLGWNNDKLSVRVNLGNGQFAGWDDLANDGMLASASINIDIVSGGEGVDISYPRYFRSLQSIDINNDGINELLMPGQRVVVGCTRKTATTSTCGDNIYSYWSHEVVDAEKYDDSVYRYDAIYFELQGDGSYRARKAATDIIAPATQLAFIDAFGDGNLDVIFNYGPHNGLNSIQSPVPSEFGSHYGAYIVRNYGAGNGGTPGDYQPVDYLRSATDGLGNMNQWHYRPLSSGDGSADQSAMYTPDYKSVSGGYVHFASSMYVVQSFEQSNGQGGGNETQYAYKDAMYHLQGRGFTGFKEMYEKDINRNKLMHSVFKEQKFPYVNLLESQTVTVAGVETSQTVNTWANNPQHSVAGVYHNILTNSVQQNWDLDGTEMSKVEQTIVPEDVDKWGNIKKQSRTVTDYIDGLANSYTSTVETEFAASEANWWLRKFNWVKTSTAAAVRGWSNDPAGTTDVAQWQKQTVDSWDSVHKRPTSITVSASNSSCSRLEETGFNAYGLPDSIKVTGQYLNDKGECANLAARQTAFSYTKGGTSAEADGYLPYEVTNAKGHVTKTEYDMGFGLPTKVTAPNSMVTATQYDAIGRPVQVKQTGSPTHYLRYLLASDGDNAPQDNANIAAVMTRTTGAGMPETEQYFDGRGRLLRSATQGFDGGYQYQDKHYDALGRLIRESIPYGNGTAAEYTEFGDFDALDRPGRRSIPNGKSGGLESRYSYSGLKTDISVEGRTMSRTYGSQGWLYETVDAKNGSNRFAYDAAGRPLVIRDANTHDIKASYNGFGHKTKVIDPNQGTTSFGYNTLGEIDRQTDANGVVQTYVYDTLGRITSKVTTGGNAPGTASFLWDSLKKGLLSSETENGVTRSYGYTAALQLSQTKVTVGTVSNTVKHQYDGFYGRPKALEYPNGLTLQYTYNDYGYLNATSNAASGYVYREISTMDEAGHITGAKLANNIMTESRVYNPEGTMASVEVDAPLGRIHGHYYDTYDAFMNLRNERNGITGLEKSYAYDDLNRLSQYSFSNSGFALYDTSSPFAATVNYDYDKVGNLLKKTDYSANSSNAYRYGGVACAAGSNAGPNAVCQLDKLSGSTVSFQYDKRGNLRLGDGLSMTYNAMDKPLSITGRGPGNSTVTAFVYGSDNMRAKQTRTVSGSTTTTYYVDKYYEVDNDGSWRAYLDDVAVLSYTPQRSHLLQFTLRDRLGSATTLADQNGNIASQRYFDPFGRTATSSKVGALGDLLDTNKNRRGFTDHEHLNEQQLIHMNGRVYDYNLGRFMSVDPFIQSPTSTQSVNPYSYIMNNPLAGTDPTGYCSTGTHIKGGDAIGCSVAFDAGSGGSGKKKSEAKPTSNGAPQVQQKLPANLQTSELNGLTQNANKWDNATSTEQVLELGQGLIEDYHSVVGGGGTNDVPSIRSAESSAQKAWDKAKGFVQSVAGEVAFGVKAVYNGISEDYRSGGVLGVVIGATGGSTEQSFFEQVNSDYASTSIVFGPLKNLDKTLTSLAVGGAMAQRYGGYSFGKLILKGPAPHLGTYGASARLAAGTTAVNSVLITGSYEGGNYVGSLLRTTINRTARLFE